MMTSHTGNTTTREAVSDYYSNHLTSNVDLATNLTAMCTAATPPYIRDILQMVHKEVKDRFYGCGVIAPECITGSHIIDLGSGSGQDCFVLSKLVGEEGVVVGVDMTQQQLDLSRTYIDYHRKVFGYKTTNVRFIRGYLEDLIAAGIKGNYFDVAVSNCVINLTKDKRAVFKEAHRCLKVGGELYCSDTFINTELEQNLRQHQTLWGEGISGALQWSEFLSILREVGFSKPYLVTAGIVSITKPSLRELLDDDVQLASAKYRVYKLPADRNSWLPAGTLMYLGGIPNVCGDIIKLDIHHVFPKDKAVLCDSETVTCVMTSRMKRYFTYKRTQHGGDEEAVQKTTDVFEYCIKTGSKSPCCK